MVTSQQMLQRLRLRAYRRPQRASLEYSTGWQHGILQVPNARAGRETWQNSVAGQSLVPVPVESRRGIFRLTESPWVGGQNAGSRWLVSYGPT